MDKEYLFMSTEELAETLQAIYFQSIVSQIYKIVGSLELVGNPVGLVSSLGFGVSAFFYEPAHAIISNPTDIEKIGRAAGELSFDQSYRRLLAGMYIILITLMMLYDNSQRNCCTCEQYN
jgi:hypothetical protein